jgi:endo-1,3(4)-beta-glucanase
MKKVQLLIIGTCIVIFSILAYFVFKNVSTGAMSFVDDDTLGRLSKKDDSGIDTSHLAAGLTPPTNKWFSGIALQKVPKTVFPTPLSFTPKEASFSVSLPIVTASSDTIFSTQPDATSIDVANATHYQVTRYDELSVDLTYKDGNDKDIGVVTLMAGSPYIYFHATSDAALSVSSTTANVTASSSSTTTVAGKTKMVVEGFDNAVMAQRATSVMARMPKNSLITLFSPPANADKQLQAMAGNRIIGTAVSYKKEGSDYSTTIKLRTDNNKQTYYTLLPHQASNASSVFGYDTLYGRQRLVVGDQMIFSTPSVAVTDSLDLSKISNVDKVLLVDTLRREINATNITADDTYFGGKAIYRSAQLLSLAKQLGEDNVASTIQQKLRTELTTWLSTVSSQEKKSFYYDTRIQGIVGEATSFGSQEFNDHHFHYGYFIYAASILAKYDHDFLIQYAPMVNLLVADIANYQMNESLPLRRLFDPYFGHSWASGSSPFNDGNNQESSSEAVNAWVAVCLWASQINDDHLAQEAGWMLANETTTAEKYWTNINVSETPYSHVYAHSLVALNWGGKRDYATFFSADSNAALGILLIPLNPTMISQLKSDVYAARQIDEAISSGNYNVQFGDYILMYSALQKKADYLEQAKLLPDAVIDGANSRSYMYAWIMSQK